jgi:hypothetical protein
VTDRSARLVASAVLAASAGAALAYNDDPDVERAFPAWLCVETASATPGFNAASIFYEIHETGRHAAEAHFRNVSSDRVSFAFWAPGRQRPGDNARVTLAPFLETREETKASLALRHGGPGLAATPLRVFDVRLGRSDATIATLPATVDVPAAIAEDAMPVRAAKDDVILRRAGLTARVLHSADGSSVVFRNPSARDLHFRFAAPALGRSFHQGDRVSAPAGRETTVTIPAARSGIPPALVRVYVADVRVGEDLGPLYAENRGDDAGWFSLATSDGSSPLPPDKLLAVVEALGAGRARVRFRSRLAATVRLRFVVSSYQRPDRDNGWVTIAPDAEAQVDVVLDAPADARLAVARVRVGDVSLRDRP